MPKGRKGRSSGGGGGRGGWTLSQEVKPVTKSVRQIEEGISSTPKVKWDPFEVLSEKMYERIFDMLDDPDDKERFMNAHSKLHDLFAPYRTQFLFGKVLKTLAENGHGIDPKYSSITRVPDGLSDSDYLNFRRVCRDWDAAVQNNIQHHPFHFQIGSINKREAWDRGTADIDWLLRKQFGWWSGNELKDTLRQINVTHPPSRNPFLTRSIRLSDSSTMGGGWFRLGGDEDDVPDTWCTQVDNFLETFGHHVWHCQFTFRQKVTPESLVQFVEWMSLMPELKTLKLRAMTGNGIWAQMHSDSELREIDDLTLELPEMAKLSLLKCEHLIPTAFNKLFSGFTGQLDKILICRRDQSLRFSVEGYQLPVNVKKAHLFAGTPEDLDHLKSFPTLSNLRTLSINLDSRIYNPNGPVPPGPGECELIWKILEETFPELEQLNLDLPEFTTDEDKLKMQEQSLRCRLKLLNLKKLRVVLSNLCSLDFIHHLQELEELHIVVEHAEWDSAEAKDLEKKETIKFNMNFEKMWESNLWEVLPKLRKLHIKATAKPSIFTKEKESTNQYGYVKNGEDREYICDIPSKVCIPRKLEAHNKLFFKSESHIWW